MINWKTWGSTYAWNLCTVLQYYACVRTSFLNEWVYYIFGARFKAIFCFDIPWLSLNLYLHFYLYGCLLNRCLCWQVDITTKLCLKCIFEHLDFYIWYSEWMVCLFFVFIWFEPISYILNNWTVMLSLKTCPYTNVIWCFQIFVSLYLFLYSWLLYCFHKTTKNNP